MPKQRESLLRAKRKWRLNHPEEAKKYNKWYYENVTKLKRASLRDHQVS